MLKNTDVSWTVFAFKISVNKNSNNNKKQQIRPYLNTLNLLMLHTCKYEKNQAIQWKQKYCNRCTCMSIDLNVVFVDINWHTLSKYTHIFSTSYILMYDYNIRIKFRNTNKYVTIFF